jgi:DNA-binding HxlR family transcriptional regulator
MLHTRLKVALAVVEGKWKALIICKLMTRNMRYHELEKILGGYRPSHLT